MILDLLRLRVNGSLGNTNMSKYNKLLGLAKEVLPSGERVLVREGDDFLRQLHELDEKHIESLVSGMDANSRAKAIKNRIIEKLAPYGEVPFRDRIALKRKFVTDYAPSEELTNNASRMVGATYFPEEYASHLNPDELDEIGRLSKQYEDNLTEENRAFMDRLKMERNLSRLNPDVDIRDIIGNTGNVPSGRYSIARDRFKKIRDAMKGEK